MFSCFHNVLLLLAVCAACGQTPEEQTTVITTGSKEHEDISRGGRNSSDSSLAETTAAEPCKRGGPGIFRCQQRGQAHYKAKRTAVIAVADPPLSSVVGSLADNVDTGSLEPAGEHVRQETAMMKKQTIRSDPLFADATVSAVEKKDWLFCVMPVRFHFHPQSQWPNGKNDADITFLPHSPPERIRPFFEVKVAGKLWLQGARSGSELDPHIRNHTELPTDWPAREVWYTYAQDNAGTRQGGGAIELKTLQEKDGLWMGFESEGWYSVWVGPRKFTKDDLEKLQDVPSRKTLQNTPPIALAAEKGTEDSALGLGYVYKLP